MIRENNKDLNKTLVYTYDNGGNIKSVKEYAYTTGTLETVTKTINYSYDSTWKDKLIKYDGDTITYDAIGNPLTYRDGMTFTWYARQMKTANVGGTAISYKYNADGLRTEKKVGSTVHKYEYTGSTLFYENRGGMELHYRYDVNGNLASITRIKADGTKFTLYAVCNSRGDVEELRQLNGSLYARYVYDTWGNTLHIYDANGTEITNTNNLAMQNPIRYRGYYYDSETGFYYLQSRYYDPVTFRFINADTYVSTGQGIICCNMFTYCNNNPINCYDKTGTITVGLFLNFSAVVGIGVTASIGIVFDANGGFDLQYSYAYGVSENLAHIGGIGLGGGVGLQFTKAKSVADLYGTSTVIGASGGPLWYVGADAISFSKITDLKEDFDGVQFNAGVGVGVDIHITQSYTGSLINNTTTGNLTPLEIKKYTLKEKLMFGGI